MSMPSRIALGSLLLISLTAQSAIAQQAWVGERNSLSASLDYVYSRSDNIRGSEEGPYLDPIFSHTAALAVEYTPIERLGLIATIPVVASRYDFQNERDNLPPHGRYDDGDYHAAVQDFRLDVRYMVVDDVVTFSPHVSVSIPMSNYETVGYAAAGRGLKMLIFGGAIGKFFTSGVPNLYLHGRYEFRWTEGYETSFPETAEVPQNKSFMDALVGYYILDTLEVNLAGSLQLAHGGFTFDEWLNEDPPNNLMGDARDEYIRRAQLQKPLQYFHDALLAEQFLHVGAGVSYQVMEQVRLSAFARFFVWGENTRNADLYGLGLSWDTM